MTSAEQAKRISSLLSCSQVGKHTMKCDDNNRVVEINEAALIRCTAQEYKIMKMLSAGQPVSDLILAHELFHCAPDHSTRKSVRKHIEHLREKIKPMGLDIPRIQGYGYILVEVP